MLKRLLSAAFDSSRSKKSTASAQPEFFIRRAIDAQKSGDREAAEAVLRECIAVHPSADSPHVFLAELLRKGDRDGEARAEYERALALGPQQPEVRFNYAAVLARIGDHVNAERVYRAVIEERPDWPEPNLNSGFLAYKRGKRESALALFERALALAPDLAQAHLGAGMASS